MPMYSRIIHIIRNVYQILQANIIARLPSCTETIQYIYFCKSDSMQESPCSFWSTCSSPAHLAHEIDVQSIFMYQTFIQHNIYKYLYL